MLEQQPPDQSSEIRRQMRQVRRDLPRDFNALAGSVDQLTDWRFYVRSMPLISVISAGLVGYACVPKRGRKATASSPRDEPTESEVAGTSVLGGAVGAMTTMALRIGMRYAVNRVSQSLLASDSSSRIGTGGQHRSQIDHVPSGDRRSVRADQEI